jgi:hypothetical protein
MMCHILFSPGMWLVTHLSSHQGRHSKPIRRNTNFDMRKTTQRKDGVMENWNDGANWNNGIMKGWNGGMLKF